MMHLDRRSWHCSIAAAGALFTTLACGPDIETQRREEGAKKIAANLEASADRADAEAAAMDAEIAHDKAIEAMYERRSWAALRRDGDLGHRSSIWLRTRAKQGRELESLIDEGRQIEDFTKPLGPRLNEATDDNRAVEPFAVKADAHRVKTAFAALARVATIDGIDVGFTELGHDSATKTGIDDWGYLVAWTHYGALVGFVYHSKQALDLDALVAETSPLVVLTRAELPKPK